MREKNRHVTHPLIIYIYISIKQTVEVKLKVCEIWIQNSSGKQGFIVKL